MAKLKWLLERFNGLTLRERVIIVAAVLISELMVVFTYLIEPAQKAHQNMQTDVVKRGAVMAKLNLEWVSLKNIEVEDPNRALKLRVEGLEASLRRLDTELATLNDNLVSATEMVRVLEQVLARQGRLRLVSAQVLAPQRIDGETAPAAVGLYRHGFEMEFEGSYRDTLEYLEMLERQKKGFFWDLIEYHVSDYPKARVRLRAHTLSMDRGWLGV